MSDTIMANYNHQLERMTDCCGAYSTIVEDGALVCKACFEEVESGQGDYANPISPDQDGQIARPQGTVNPKDYRWLQWAKVDNLWLITFFHGWLIHSSSTTNDWDVAHTIINKHSKECSGRGTIPA